MQELNIKNRCEGVDISTTIKFDVEKMKDSELQEMMESHNVSIMNLSILLYLIKKNSKIEKKVESCSLPGFNSFSIFDDEEEDDDFFK